MRWLDRAVERLDGLVPGTLVDGRRDIARFLVAYVLFSAASAIMVWALPVPLWFQLSLMGGGLLTALSFLGTLRLTRSVSKALWVAFVGSLVVEVVAHVLTGAAESPFQVGYLLVGALPMAFTERRSAFVPGLLTAGAFLGVNRFGPSEALVDVAALGGPWLESLVLAVVMAGAFGAIGHARRIQQDALVEAKHQATRAEHSARRLLLSGVDLEHALAEAERQRAVAERASETKTEALAVLSHELRTPLHGIAGLADLLLADSVDPGLEALGRSARAAGRLVGDLLRSAESADGTLQCRPHAVAPEQLFEDLHDVFAAELLARGQVLLIETGALPTALLVDRGLLRRLLSAILTFPVGSGSDVSVQVRAEPVEGAEVEVVLHIEPWMAEVDTAQIVPRVQDLLGVDLAGENGVLELRFVTLEATLPEGKHIASLDRTLRVLVADDNAVNRMVLTGMLTRLNCHVEAVEDGQQLVDTYRAAPEMWDAIVTDLQMPVMDGLEAVAELRRTSEGRELPVVVVTAHAMPSYRQRSRRLGVDAFLAKPLDTALLKAAIQRIRAGDRGGLLTDLATLTDGETGFSYRETV